MSSRKEYEMLFQLNAQMGGNYSKTFRAAQQEIASMQKEIQALSKTQADISAYQKQRPPWKRRGSGWKCCGSNMTTFSERWRKPATTLPT